MFFRTRSKKYIAKKFTHRAWLLCVPVYVCINKLPNGDYVMEERDDGIGFPMMEERNWIPQPLFYLAWLLLGAWVQSAASVGWEVHLPLYISSVIEDDDDDEED